MNDEDQINLPILILCGGKGTRFKSTKLNTSKNIMNFELNNLNIESADL